MGDDIGWHAPISIRQSTGTTYVEQIARWVWRGIALVGSVGERVEIKRKSKNTLNWLFQR